MTWFTLAFVFSSFLLIFFNVQPFWLQALAFGISFALFIPMLIPSVPRSQRVQGWFQKKLLWVLGIAFLLTLNGVARKYEYIFDLSKTKLYDLRPETIEWIKKIDEPVEILIFLRSDDKTFPYAEWLQKQMGVHSSKIRVQIKNINQEVSLAKRYEVKQTGEVILLSGDQWVKVGNFKQHTLLQGLIRLSSKSSSSVCFLIGHGEPDIEEEGPESLSSLKQSLNDLGYKTQSVALLQKEPEDLEKECGVLWIMNPKSSFLPEEEGKFVRLLHSALPIGFALDSPVSPTLVHQLKEEGVDLSESLVVNPENLKQRVPLTDVVVQQLTLNSLTQGLKRGLYLPNSLALTTQPSPPHRSKACGEAQMGGRAPSPPNTPHRNISVSCREVTEEESTNSGKPISWITLLQTPSASPYRLLGKENEAGGAFLLAVQGQEKEKPSRIIFGSGRAFLNRSLSFMDNQSLFLNTLRWLLDEKEIDTQWVQLDSQERYLKMSPQEIFWVKNLSFYLLPGLAWLLCFLLWARRQFLT